MIKPIKEKTHRKHMFENEPFKILTIWGETLDARRCLKRDCATIEVEYKPLLPLKK